MAAIKYSLEHSVTTQNDQMALVSSVESVSLQNLRRTDIFL